MDPLLPRQGSWERPKIRRTLVSMPDEAMLGGGLEAWSFTSTQGTNWREVAIDGVQRAMRWPWALDYVCVYDFIN